MKVSFHGLGQQFVTFPSSAASADVGKVCKIGTGGTAAVCADGDGFFGVITELRAGAACVQTQGFVELAFSGTAPTPGWCGLAADGQGGVKTSSTGHEFLVVTVDATAGIVGMWL